MAWELILWLLIFLLIMSLLIVTVYQFICLADLESDHINPYESSANINACVVPEFLIQGALTLIFLLSWRWFMLLVSVPVSYYHVKLYMNRKHLIDVTEIFRSLDGEKKYRLVKLGFYLVLFFIGIYRLVEVSVTLAMAEDDAYHAGLL